MDTRDRNRDINRQENRDRNINERRDRDMGNEKHLHFLSDLSDYKVASDNPDVRGWDVLDESHKRVGKVDNLLVDPRAEKVRYLDIELDEKILKEGHEPYAHGKSDGVHEYQNRDGETHMIVPIGLAKVDDTKNNVISDKINRHTIENGFLHRKGDHISPEHERSVVSTLSEAERRNTPRASNEYAKGSENAEPLRETKKHGDIDSRRETREEARTGNERYEEDLKNREMRRPESSSDSRLSQEARRKERVTENPVNTGSDKYGSDSTKPHRSESWSFETERKDRHGRFDEASRGPVQSNFYTHRYFDEDRFYGRK